MQLDIINLLLLLYIIFYEKDCCRKYTAPHYELGAMIIDGETLLYNLNTETMAQQVSTTQAPFSVLFENPVDSQGAPTTASGREVWSSSDEAIGSVVVNETNTLRGEVTLTGTPGAVTFTITDPVTGVSGIAEVEVVESVQPIADFGEPTFLGLQP